MNMINDQSGGVLDLGRASVGSPKGSNEKKHRETLKCLSKEGLGGPLGAFEQEFFVTPTKKRAFCAVRNFPDFPRHFPVQPMQEDGRNRMSRATELHNRKENLCIFTKGESR